MHNLDAQRGAACRQFLLGDLVGRQQSALATNQADQSRTGALDDTESGEFGIEAGPFPSTPLTSACHWPAVKGGEINDKPSVISDN